MLVSPKASQVCIGQREAAIQLAGNSFSILQRIGFAKLQQGRRRSIAGIDKVASSHFKAGNMATWAQRWQRRGRNTGKSISY
jgi:hypothetical protein